MVINEILPYIVIIGISALIAFSLSLFFYRVIKKKLTDFDAKLSTNQMLANDFQMNISLENEKLWKATNDLQKIVIESEQVIKLLDNRIKVLQKKNEQLEIKIDLAQAPEDKLYSRASKLVELGADIHEIMKECDIPRAEAEMLLAIHRK